MYLVDTNIFLEILLKQEKSSICKKFLNSNTGKLHISDFSLHSLGVILLRNNENELLLKFLKDILPNVYLVSLPKDEFNSVIINSANQKLDFDDAYQFTVCHYYGFTLVTMDQDFRRVHDIDILFL